MMEYKLGFNISKIMLEEDPAVTLMGQIIRESFAKLYETKSELELEKIYDPDEEDFIT